MKYRKLSKIMLNIIKRKKHSIPNRYENKKKEKNFSLHHSRVAD